MSQLFHLVLFGFAGMGLGLFYFGGLWLTIRQLTTCRWPALLLVGSFAGRTALTLVGFYLAMGGRWERVAACMVGFTIVRLFLVSRLRPERAPAVPRGSESV